MSEAETGAMVIIRVFVEFLKTFREADPEAKQAFLEFIDPQTREDLIALAENLKEKTPNE